MKKVFSILLMMVAISATVSAQQLEKLFDKYMEDERFNYIYQKRPNMMERIGDGEDYFDVSSQTSLGRQMLTLNSGEKALDERFTKEVENAIKADKYEQVSIVRNGKNRVETYEKTTNKGKAKVSFIKNPGNVMVTLNLYGQKQEK